VIRVGLVTGIVTGIGATVNPYIEFYADNLPERRVGAFGIGLIRCGFSLQSLQYWLALFDVSDVGSVTSVGQSILYLRDTKIKGASAVK